MSRESKLALAVFSTILIVLGILSFIRARAAMVQHKPIFFRYPLLIRGGTSMDPWQAFAVDILCLIFATLAILWAFKKPKE